MPPPHQLETQEHFEVFPPRMHTILPYRIAWTYIMYVFHNLGMYNKFSWELYIHYTPHVVLLRISSITANLHYKSRNLSSTDVRKYSIDLR